MHIENFQKVELHDCDTSKRTSPVVPSQSLQCNQTPARLLGLLLFVFCTEQPATLAYSNRDWVQNVDKLMFVIESWLEDDMEIKEQGL